MADVTISGDIRTLNANDVTIPAVTITGQLVAGAKGDTGATGATGASGVVQSVVAGTNVTVDATDPANPIVSSTGGGGGGGGSGDMLASTYDPQTIAGDAFNTDNHTSGTTNKVYTATEQTRLANTSGTNTGDQTLPTALTDLDTTVTGLQLNTLYSNNTGTNTGDQTLPTALTDLDTTVTGTQLNTLYSNTSGTNTGDQTLPTALTDLDTTVTGTQLNTLYSNTTGTNTGDQTSVTGNSGTTNALNSATTVVNVSSATAPTTGQTLTATSATTATWQTPAGGGGQTLYDITVDASGADYTTIGDAIAAVTSGQTIFVRNGTYTLTATTTTTATDVTVVGESRTATIINASTFNFNLNGAGNTLQNLTITRASGSTQSSSDNFTVQDCDINLGASGQLLVANYSSISNCYITNTGNSGRVFLNGNYNRFVNNTFDGVAGSASNSGALNVNGQKCNVTGNIFEISSGTDRAIISCSGSGDFAVISGNMIYDAGSGTYAITLAGADNVAITGNTFSYVKRTIWWSTAQNGVVFSGNTVLQSGDVAITVSGNRWNISGNTIANASLTGIGIDVLATYDDTIINGNVIHNFATGIDISASTNDRTMVTSNNYFGCTTGLVDAGTTTTTANNI